MKKAIKIAAFVGLLVTGFLVQLKLDRMLDGLRGVPSCPEVDPLKPNEQERIIIDPAKHRIVQVKRKDGKQTTETKFLPNRPSTVMIGTDGSVKIIAKASGIGLQPALGLSLGDRPRIGLLAELAYYKRLNLGVGLASDFKLSSVRPLGFVGVTVYRNTSAYVAYDTGKDVQAGIYLRF